MIEHGEPLVVSDVRGDKRFNQQIDRLTGFSTESIIALPMRCGERTTGVVEIINFADDISFGEEKVRLLQAFVDQASVALENLIERLVVLNQKDDLDVADLPPEYREPRRLTSTVDDDADIKKYQDALRENRIEIIRNALVHTNENQAAAAKLLKIQPSYLCKMIKDLGMRE